MSFERLLKPRTIAIFGGTQAQEVIRQSDLMDYEGEIWPVHPKKNRNIGAQGVPFGGRFARKSRCGVCGGQPLSHH
ncbi:MAG: hypothetical protein AB1Z31_16840 [Desulfobacterales bacterium]